jgi:hypothetical protein
MTKDRLRMMASRQAKLALTVFVALTLLGCSNDAPVAVSNCTVRASGKDALEFEVSLRPLVNKSVDTIYVIASTDGRGGHDGSQIEYEFEGRMPTNLWTSRRAIKKVEADPATTLDEHLGIVKSCYVNKVNYRDGSHWFGGADL